MSSRARRVENAQLVRRFEWSRVGPETEDAVSAAQAPVAPPEPPGLSAAEQQARLASLEREAFAKGYAAGERAGVEAGAKRADGMLRRLAQTLEELSNLRRTIIHETERQMVDLSLTLARKVVMRELTFEPDLVAAMAHVALERLGETAPATIRLNPDDYAVVTSHRGEQWEGPQVTVVPDPAVARGGCLVESEFGHVDASVEAQFDELSRILLGGPARERTGASDAA